MRPFTPLVSSLAFVVALAVLGCAAQSSPAPSVSTTATGVPTASTTAAAKGLDGTWVELRQEGKKPQDRSGASVVYDSTSGKVVVFGGVSSNWSCWGDTWVYDPATDGWTQCLDSGDGPGPRSGSRVVYDEASGRVLLFGGYRYTSSGSSELDDVWAYDPVANVWTDIVPPGNVPLFYGSSVVYVPNRGQVILFGGFEGRETWSYNPGTNVWISLYGGASTGLDSAMAYDPSRGMVILFGGYEHSMVAVTGDLFTADATTTYCFDGTWAYDPVTGVWTELRPRGDRPAGRFGHSMVYDPRSGTIIMYGGQDANSRRSDTWAYDVADNTWTELHYDNMPRGSMIYDSVRSQMLLFGAGSLSGRVWVYRPRLTVDHGESSLTNRQSIRERRSRGGAADGEPETPHNQAR